MTFNRWRYWRDRMFDKLKALSMQTDQNLAELLENAEHINLNTTGIKKEIKKINKAYIELEKAVMASRSKK